MHDGVVRESGFGTAMVRDRGAAMLGAFVDGLGTGDARQTRARFEQVVRDHLGVDFVRFRECAPGALVPDLDPALAVSRVTSGGRTFALEIPRPTRAGQDQAWHALVATAGQLGAIVAEIERTAGYRVAISTLADRDGNRLTGSSPAIQAVRQQIDRVARTDFTVLIEGESGVGKELVARQIHQWSRRSRGPFVAVNCAAIVESLLEAELFGIEDRTATGVRGRRGKLEQANGGSLFLDEVADLSLAAQAKLLRALQEFSVERVGGHQTKKVDIRIMAATNRSLSALVAKGQFRGDLYYRLNALELRVPPLRSRREDIMDLAQACLERHAGVGGPCRLSTAAFEALLTYEWPGNVRELERVIERAITLAEGEEIQLSDLPPALSERYSIVQPATEGHESMRAWGSRYARLVLERCKNNKRQACKVLDISYHTLQAYLRYTPKLKARRRLDGEDAPGSADPIADTVLDEPMGGEPDPIDPSPMEATLVAE
jgi:transcriptional regulator with PAS, ATPase and Fis domain